ncbi:e3 ubiquitin-protein ligase UBR4 domain-containing protein [Phthorimaea operculella]|nr:e3 ubiquitin-protein ligase UBR4 domain-containing protein [Phthorimaea operculella]
MVQTIGALLDKADRVYRQLTANKPVLESLLHKISEHRLEGRTGDENSNASNTSFSGAQINRVIQTLAHKYCVDSKGHFEDLSKIIQKVLACRYEKTLLYKLDTYSNASNTSFSGAQINRVIQTLAHKYCVDSKGHFEDLSKIIQKVLACSGAQINRVIQTLAHKYCVDSKGHFEDLSKIIQKVLACSGAQINRVIQTLAHKYCVDSKGHFEDLSKIIQKVLACSGAQINRVIQTLAHKYCVDSKGHFEDLTKIIQKVLACSGAQINRVIQTLAHKYCVDSKGHFEDLSKIIQKVLACSGAQINRVIQTLAHKYCVDSKGHFEDLSKIIQKVLACSGAQINRVIQTLAHKYCVDSKGHFEDLSKIIQKVLACSGAQINRVIQTLAHKYCVDSKGHFGDLSKIIQKVLACSGAQINRVIQTLAHKYCVDSKGHFEDLSKIIQKVLACRKELVAYDRSQSEATKGDTLPVYAGLVQNYDGDLSKESGGTCYGCSLAAAEHCLTLLRALASQPEHRTRLCRFGLVQELVQHNLHRGTPQCQEEVRALICLVTRDNLPATEQLCNMLTQRITLSLMGHAASQDHNNSVRPLVLLLGSLVKVSDSVECWESRLRCIVKLWVWCCPNLTEVAGIPPAANAILKAEALAGLPSINATSPNSHQFALQQVALPCLRYMQQLMAPIAAAPSVTSATDSEQSKDGKEVTPQTGTTVVATALTPSTGNVVVDLAAWLAGRVPHKQWRRLVPTLEPPPADGELLPPRDKHLAFKYVSKWRERTLLANGMRPLDLQDGGWLRPVMFDPSSRIARDTACQMVKSLCDSYERTKARTLDLQDGGWLRPVMFDPSSRIARDTACQMVKSLCDSYERTKAVNLQDGGWLRPVMFDPSSRIARDTACQMVKSLCDSYERTKAVSTCILQILLSYGMRPLDLQDGGWLRPVMFDPSSRIARDTACQMVKSLCDSYERTKAQAYIRPTRRRLAASRYVRPELAHRPRHCLPDGQVPVRLLRTHQGHLQDGGWLRPVMFDPSSRIARDTACQMVKSLCDSYERTKAVSTCILQILLSYGMRTLDLQDGGWLRPVMFDPSSRIARDTACQMVKSLCDSYERTKAVSTCTIQQILLENGMRPLDLQDGGWLRPVMFDPSSRIVRDTACQMVKSLCDSYERTKAILDLQDGGWLRPVMFDPSSRIARDTACQMVKSLCDSYERTKAVIILLTNFLPEVGRAGEASEQFLQLYQSLASEAPWKQFLALRGVLQQIADLMTKEIEQLHRLEETTLTSDLAQGYALKRLTELLAMFLEEPGARRTYKGRLVGCVLGGYLSLRRLVVQRTRLTDDTQEKLLELLEEMTTGTETETAEFMAVCIETVQKYPLHDYRTPVFIFERLCSIIYPEENDVGEFFLTLEKDPQQEDFLQGRMLGNPYSSLEPGMGPLMRDVKNKICTDCELVALLEDDNGMELLVCNKIMSLDLPVKEVYKKVWCTSGEGVDAMRVVYRMRGLLGDATEEFVETLTQTNAEAVDDEQTYRMANVLADCGGLEVMLQRLAAIQRVGAARALVSTLLRLLGLCTRVRRGVCVLTRADTRALPVLLHALHLAAQEERDLPRPQLVYQLLEIMERILSVAASDSLESFLQFSLTFGGPEYVQALLNCTEIPGIRSNQVALGHLTRVLAALVYGNDLKMAMLVDHFKPVLDFDRLDSEQWTEEEFRMELFCVLCANIERNSIGGTLKDYLISLGVVRDALDYIQKHAPCVKPTLVCTDSDELKEFISRPALKYILRFLTGLATDHEPTQMLVCEKVIPIVHRLEQVSSGEHVGSLAENLLEALRSQPQCAAKVQEVRDFTRQEKKRLAMAVRERQLGALGMRSNERGQVTAQCSLTQQVLDLAEEQGAVCCICREGYKYQPTKVLGIYTFTKRCPVEEYEVRARKTLGYTTVSHYNIVHVECHMAAVRLARAR